MTKVMTNAENLAQAMRYHESGQHAAAEQICRQMLAADPQHAEALHLLGIIACQAGQYVQAAEHLEAALQGCGHDARFHHSLGIVRYHQGRKEEAIACYRRAIELQPNLAPIHNNLGNVLRSQGQADQAIACYERALRLDADFAEAHNNLGNLFKELGRLAEAEASYRSAVRLRPDLPQPHFNLGLVLARQGRLADAVQSYREALRLWPDYAEAHIALGDALTKMDRLVEAEASYRQALALRPNWALVHNNLGVVLSVLGRAADLRAKFERPSPQIASLSGAAPLTLPSPPAAGGEGRVRGAAALSGAALEAQSKRDEAIACHEQAIRLRPDYGDALNNLATCYLHQGRLEEALACYRKAIVADPQDAVIHGALLFASHYAAGYEPEACFAEHLRWAQKFADPSARQKKGTVPLSSRGQSPFSDAREPLDRDPDRRLRIGYVSPDFYPHVVGRYSEGVIAAHDRDQFEVFCYADVSPGDVMTERIRASADHWRSLVGRSHAEAANLILQDRIDLLIDLAGHTAGNRLLTFAQRPAPVQVTHFGYPASSGMAAMDYRLTDALCDPPGETERWHTEKLVRLPRAWWCFVPWDDVAVGPLGNAEVGPLPAQEAGHVTLACACTLGKVTDEMIGLWAEILLRLPRGRMLLVTGAGSAGDERARATFRNKGIAAERVTLVPRQRLEAYQRLFQGVDIVLDVYPFTGCNTTADALWMGVPVVSRFGPSAATRQGLSILSQVGLEDLAVPTPAAYVETAVRLAHDLPRLRELRATLRDRVQQTLGDVQRFTRELEAAYRGMWQTYCSSEW